MGDECGDCGDCGDGINCGTCLCWGEDNSGPTRSDNHPVTDNGLDITDVLPTGSPRKKMSCTGCSLQAYRSFLHDTGVQMGPEANIAPIISRLVGTVSNYARSLKNYHVLVVLATGEIETDEEKTKMSTAYRSFLHDTSVQMGPEANIAPTISRLVGTASNYARSLKNYHVLVVLATGEIETDEEKTTMSTVMLNAHQRIPLTIIFVGIDGADLTKLETMYRKMFAQYRDNFYSMSIYETDLDGESDSNAYRRTELLAKLPQQIVSYTSFIRGLNVITLNF